MILKKRKKILGDTVTLSIHIYLNWRKILSYTVTVDRKGLRRNAMRQCDTDNKAQMRPKRKNSL